MPIGEFIARNVPATLDGILGEGEFVWTAEIIAFIKERLSVQLRSEGARHDLLNAIYLATKGVSRLDLDFDVVVVMTRAEALAKFLHSQDGANLLAAYKRASNILRIEERKDGPFDNEFEPYGANEYKIFSGAR